LGAEKCRWYNIKTVYNINVIQMEWRRSHGACRPLIPQIFSEDEKLFLCKKHFAHALNWNGRYLPHPVYPFSLSEMWTLGLNITTCRKLLFFKPPIITAIKHINILHAICFIFYCSCNSGFRPLYQAENNDYNNSVCK